MTDETGAEAEAAGSDDAPLAIRAPFLKAIGHLVLAMRPHQWVKNLFVVLPIVFAKTLLDGTRFVHVIATFAAFCGASSAVYLLNDVVDVASDRLHPTKRHRPIASGAISESLARSAAFALGVVAVGATATFSRAVAITIAGYLALNLAYSFGLKKVAYLDVVCIALGFELRVLAGMFAVDAKLSTYLLVVTFALASFLGFGKRLHEHRQSERSDAQRASLRRYDERPLVTLMVVAGGVTALGYLAATIDPSNVEFFHTRALAITTVFTAFGIWRFASIVNSRTTEDSPTESMLRDRPFLLNLAAWFLTVVAIVYVHL